MNTLGLFIGNTKYGIGHTADNKIALLNKGNRQRTFYTAWSITLHGRWNTDTLRNQDESIGTWLKGKIVSSSS